MRIHISTPIDQETRLAAMFREALPDADVALVDGASANGVDLAPADYVVIGYRNAGLFDRERRMKAIFAFSAGVRHLLALPNLPRDVPVIRLEDAGMAEQMVRYVLAATLRFTQRFDLYAGQQREALWRDWKPRAPHEFRIGVLGLGVIGSEIARSLAKLGFSVRGFAQRSKSIEGIQSFAGSEALDLFLTDLDVLVSVLALTPETIGILNRATLSRLARGAHVINIGRGAHLVDADLLALIDEGKLSGATLDVFNEEPLPADHPFWRRPEIAITPHVAGVTLPDQAVAQIAAKIRLLERGSTVTGIVDRERGY
ncbi:MAG TPA: glyoxylate/hydroxypyruvate reductase A [Casimicrobiaceae bacterium]|jgi:glyoxylate/hydroxypyruvate reductase A